MTVAFDAISIGNQSNVTSVSFTHTPVGTPSAVAVAVYGFQFGAVSAWTATYGGITMTRAFVPVATSSPDGGVIFGLPNPPPGPQTVVVTNGGSGNGFYPIAYCVSVTGSDKTTCFSASGGNSSDSGTSLSVNLTGTRPGDLVLCVGGVDGAGISLSLGSGSNTTVLNSNTANSNEKASCSYGMGAVSGSTFPAAYTASGSVSWVIIAAAFKDAPPSRGPGDPYWNNVVLLCNFEGGNNDTDIYDESSHQHGDATFNGASSISTAYSKYGRSSLHLTGFDNITWPDSPDWDFGTGQPYTVECFVLSQGSYVGAGVQKIVGQWDSPNWHDSWMLYIYDTGFGFGVSTDSNGSNTVGVVGGGTASGAWQHIASDYDGTTYRLYLDGACVASNTTAPYTIYSSDQLLTIGAYTSGGFYFTGYIDSLRITKGKARYASDSYYPVPTESFPNYPMQDVMGVVSTRW